MISSVTSLCDFEYCPLYSYFKEGGSKNKLHGQYPRNVWEYRNYGMAIFNDCKLEDSLDLVAGSESV